MESLIFDSHAHYDDAAFQQDREALLAALPGRGVCGVINVGADLDGCRDSVAFAVKYPYFHAGVGIHPECVKGLPWDWLQQIEQLAASPGVVAIGEIGLDYHFDDMAPKEMQKKVFEDQLLLADRLGLPVIIHDRDAHGDMMTLLRRHRPKGVVHCFSGSVEMMREIVSLGMYIGLGGAVTFKNARVPLEVARAVPLDRLLTETDCPYMAPVPFRGKRCDSTMILHSAEKIAGIKGISTAEVLAAGKYNAEALFSLSKH